jgi:hypothetical protein
MPNSRQPLFLARASYRKRRLRDGARLLPIFGALMLLVPLLWPDAGRAVAAHWAFVFVVWAVLIGIAALLSRKLAEVDGLGDYPDVAPPPPDPDPDQRP